MKPVSYTHLFERWVFDEVLPALRKNGIYITDPLVRQFARDPDFAHAVVDLSLIHI